MIRALLAALALTFATAAAPAVAPKEDHRVIASFEGLDASDNPVGITIIQQGRFHCAVGQHRAVMINRSSTIWLGCATIGTNNIVLVFEDGSTLTVPYTNPRGI